MKNEEKVYIYLYWLIFATYSVICWKATKPALEEFLKTK